MIHETLLHWSSSMTDKTSFASQSFIEHCIKQLISTDNATSVEIEELLGELDLMRNMTPHENILNLLGQCTTPGRVV